MDAISHSRRVIQERDWSDNPSVAYTRGTDLSGSLEGASGIGGLLARSQDFSVCTNVLTVRITNDWSLYMTIWISDESGTLVDGVVIGSGSAQDFTFETQAGHAYVIYGHDYAYAVEITDSFAATLGLHQLVVCDKIGEYSTPESGPAVCGADLTGQWLTHNYYHADGNGNITALESSLETLSASYRSDPFGNTISQSGGLADANVYRFSSKEVHTASGLYYFGERWYAPGAQRWLNRDPIGEAGGLNLYCYVGNDPIDFVDLFGFSAADVRRLLDLAQNSTDTMTRTGHRFPSGAVNNALRVPQTVENLLNGLLGLPKRKVYKGCGEQADRLAGDLNGVSTDDKWQFYQFFVWQPSPHQFLVAKSSNPKDPILYLDPWNNKFSTKPPAFWAIRYAERQGETLPKKGQMP